MNGSRFIAETFAANGLTAAFFVPSILKGVLVEFERLGVRRVLCHSEKSAAYMADGYARVKRAPGLAMAQSVGAANLAAGLQDAWLACSPVVALTGRWPSLYRHRHAYQEVDHKPLYDPVTKFNGFVDQTRELPLLLQQALREANSGTPGPVHLDLMGFQGEAIADEELAAEVVIDRAFQGYPAYRPRPERSAVEAALKLLAGEKRPVIVAGGGVTASDAGEELVALAERLQIPVATSLNGKGSIVETHPLSIGVVGMYSRSSTNQIVSDADVVFFVGSHTGGQATHFWQVPCAGTTVIQLDVNPSELGRNYPNSVSLLGDVKASLREMIDTSDTVAPRDDWMEHVRSLGTAWRAEYQPLFDSDAVPIRPERLCRELTNWLPHDAILVSDTGHAGIWTGTMVELTDPAQTYIRCAGSLGWGFPAALGAKCAAPDRPVICFTGDGGIWYHLSELETARRSGIATVTIVNNNRSLNQDKAGVDRAYGDSTSGNPDEIWVFDDVNFAEIARSMGCFGIRVESPGQITDALQQALDSGQPSVVDVVSDIEAFAPLAHVPAD